MYYNTTYTVLDTVFIFSLSQVLSPFLPQKQATGWMLFLMPNQQYQSTEGNLKVRQFGLSVAHLINTANIRTKYLV